MIVASLVVLLVLALWLLHVGRPWGAWVIPIGLGLVAWRLLGEDPGAGLWTVAVLYALAVLVLGFAPVRRALLTPTLMRLLAPIFPTMSPTEAEALEAGTVWWDRELFSGRPDWDQLLGFDIRGLSPDEEAFLAGPCTELCRLIDDWEIINSDDLPEEVWSFLKQHGFLGMIIPKEYGGLGFSARANGAVVARVSSRSVTAGVTVMVPNSLGPAELLLHYGTDEQKRHYLPRLARGEEIPCFALTEPLAGSDAGSMTSRGVVCRGTWEGEEVLGMRLTWDKRYITLSAVATVIGLAFKLEDPDGLLGGEADLGITCALIPASTPGAETGPRHDPLGVPFVNGTTRGEDVFVPLEFIIGGPAMAGKGWRMLMQSLAAGRGISLPAQSCGAAQMATRTVGAYATVREQFKLPIGRFEGIQERIGVIAGTTYWLDAARWLTAGAIDAGEKPAVITAIVKAYSTEAMREVVNHGMDVIGGSGIVRGPRNILARAYQALPIGITVEGANILTRSMIVFGQGAIRCHRHALDEMKAVADRDVKRFDAAFFGHVGHIASTFTRASVLGWTNGLAARVPVEGPAERYFQHFERMSAAYAVCAEVAMGTLGGALKRKEMLTGRLADGLAWLYLGTAALKRFVDDGQPQRDLPLCRWASEHALLEIERALLGLLDNLPNRPAAWLLRWKLFPFHARFHGPTDSQVRAAARAVLDGGEAREALTPDLFLPGPEEPGLGVLEAALAKTLAAAPAEDKVKEAMRAGRLERGPVAEAVDAALAAGVLEAAEAASIREAIEARHEAVQVDAFGEVRRFEASAS
jgi:acyl-CoA dehydrogenase